MLTKDLLDALYEIQDGEIQLGVPLSEFTTFKIGGPADALVEPAGPEKLAELVRLMSKTGTPFFILGAGSNLLVSDKGFRGVVIRTGAAFDTLSAEGNTISAGCGVKLAKLAAFAAERSLSGLEFASGIPGLVGGAVFMNAGAYGGEMKDVVVETEFVDNGGNLRTATGSAHDFSYRHSVFSGGGKYIVGTKVQLTPGGEAEIRAKMKELNARRKEKQPLEFPSAGSTFKRPEGYFAAKLIEDAGLKGAAVGGAEVSRKHAGFVINRGGATAEDVLRLIRHIQETVLEKFGVMLDTEVKLVGEFGE